MGGSFEPIALRPPGFALGNIRVCSNIYNNLLQLLGFSEKLIIIIIIIIIIIMSFITHNINTFLCALHLIQKS